MTKAEILAKINEESQFQEVFRDFIDSHWEDELGKTIINGIEFELIRAERENESYYVTFKVGEDLFELQGSYDSNEGVEFWNGVQSFYPVKAEQRMVTVYIPI